MEGALHRKELFWSSKALSPASLPSHSSHFTPLGNTFVMQSKVASEQGLPQNLAEACPAPPGLLVCRGPLLNNPCTIYNELNRWQIKAAFLAVQGWCERARNSCRWAWCGPSGASPAAPDPISAAASGLWGLGSPLQGHSAEGLGSPESTCQGGFSGSWNQGSLASVLSLASSGWSGAP